MTKPVLINARVVFKASCSAILLLVAIHGLVVSCWTWGSCGVATPFAMNFGGLFDLNQEMNVPTWFSVTQLGAVTATLWCISCAAKARGQRPLPWNGLVVLFLYLSIDEMTDIHGLWGSAYLGQPIAAPVVNGFAWLVPAGVVVAVVVAIYLRWVLSLPSVTRNLFILAGAVFVTGGLGFELVGKEVADATFFNPAYILASTLEEMLEMLGVAIMLYAAINHLQMMGVTLAFTKTPAKGKPAGRL
ncbi:MAG: hypothetical protein WA784_16165 [Albidovulum sp.]